MKALMMPVIAVTVLCLFGCESANEHFCAKYSYYYNEFSQPDILPHSHIREQLEAELVKNDSDKARMMLFVLNEMAAGVKPSRETAQDYCVRRQRWTAFGSRR